MTYSKIPLGITHDRVFDVSKRGSGESDPSPHAQPFDVASPWLITKCSPKRERLHKHQSKTWTDARSIKINALYEQLIWGFLAFWNSVNTSKHPDPTYLKSFSFTSHIASLWKFRNSQTSRPTSLAKALGPAWWRVNNLSWRSGFQQPQPLLQVERNLLLHLEDAAISLQAKESQQPRTSLLKVEKLTWN